MTAITAISEQALAFLDGQRLPPTPQNYWLGFACHDGLHDELARTIAAMLDGGVRLQQTEADELYERFSGRAAAPAPRQAGPTPADLLRHQTIRLAEMTASAAAVTGEFSRELAGQMPGIAAADPAMLGELVGSTLARAQRSERELAAMTAEVEELRQKLETVQGDAERDVLTGLPNRRGIDAELARRLAAGDDAVLAICDIDRFKSYNDRYGHAVGDRVLKTVAQTLREAFDGEFVGRWGGEEFLVVLGGALGDGAARLEAAKETLGAKHFKLRETDEPMGRITFSAGAVRLPGDGADLAAALERADALLYRAKDAGRDLIFTEDAAAEPPPTAAQA